MWKTLSHWLRHLLAHRMDWKDHNSAGVGSMEIDGAVRIRHMKPTAFTSGFLLSPSYISSVGHYNSLRYRREASCGLMLIDRPKDTYPCQRQESDRNSK